MMLGIAAKSSMAMVSGFLINGGAISVEKIAMPMEAGMANDNAIMVVTKVP